jgi:pilus assembly protein Flp/PilA
MLNRFLKSRDGATAIEYGLIATFIAIVIIGSLTALGVNLDAIFVDVSAGFD